jgi:putative heme-binding domain-containing protein
VDSFGTVFVSDNDDDGNQQTRICYVMPGGNYGYQPRGPGQSHWHEEQPGVVPKILRTYFGSPTGMCVYEGTLLPKKYWGQLLHTDAGPRHVRCYHLTPQGAGYDVEREDMVTSTDNWFRPSDICVAPDGSVFVADWYDPGVGGHGMGDITRGRVYRITPMGHKGYDVPKVDLDSHKGMATALASPNLAVRYMAVAKTRTLSKGDVTEVTRYGLGLAMKQPLWLAARVLWLREQPPDSYLSFISPSSPLYLPHMEPVSLQGVRHLAARYSDLALAPEVVRRQLREDAIQASPAVRREILLALRSTDPAFAREIILPLAAKYDGKDRFYLEAIGIAVGHHDKARRDVILAGFEKEFPEWNDKVADLVWELRPPAMLASLGGHLKDPKLTATQRGRVVDILASSDDPAAGKALLDLLQSELPAEVRARVLQNLEKFLPGPWSGLRQAGELTAAIDALLARPEGRETALRLIAAAGRTGFIPRVREMVVDEKTPEGLRREAVRTLGKLPEAGSVSALAPFAVRPDALGADARQALGVLASRPGEVGAKALEPLKAALASAKAAPEVRAGAAVALAGTRPGSVWLLGQARDEKLDAPLRAEVVRLLRNSPYQDLRNKALVAFPPPGRLDPKKLPSPAVLAMRTGDASRGRRLLEASINNDLQCLKCHTVRGVGGLVGPDLSMIGKKASKENLFESILYPSKAVADQYINWQIETTRGLQLVGLVVEETAEGITLRDANGKDTKIARKDVESKSKSAKSLMPEDLVAYMTEDDLVDLVACLYELKTPSLTVDAWHIAGPFDNGEGDAGLDEVFAPEKGVDLAARYRGKLGEVRWRTVRPDAKGYVDLAAFFAPDSANIVSYLYQEIESPESQEATLLLGTDDGCKLWVNGALIHTSRAHRAAVPAQDTVRLRLRKGPNRVLLKINNGDGPHGFYFTLLAEQELKRVAGR